MNLKIKHTLLPTIVDGKVCNAATNTSSTMRCYLCNQTSKQFNKLMRVTVKEINTDALKFGLFRLHIQKAEVGNTNCGNTQRRFFSDIDTSARITGINKDLIFQLKVILETIISGFEINIAKFEEFALETAKLYVSLYGCYPMPPTLRKILMHGAIIEHAIVPIGQLSREAAEVRNKHFHKYRSDFS